MNKENSVIIDKEIVRNNGRKRIEDVVVYKRKDNAISITSASYWKKMGVNVNFEDLVHINFGSRRNNEKCIQNILNGRVSFEELLQ
jgi:hypothetical protein